MILNIVGTYRHSKINSNVDNNIFELHDMVKEIVIVEPADLCSSIKPKLSLTNEVKLG